MSDNTTQNPPFILALTIIKGTTALKYEITNDSQILVCVRDSKANKTHPDVVSVPTQRIPTVLAEQVLGESSSIGSNKDTKLLSNTPIFCDELDGHNELLYMIESLLCRKLGLSNALEEGLFRFKAILAGNLIGKANYPNLNTSEHLQMLNAVVFVEVGADLVPEQTASYRKIHWTPSTSSFLEMWHNGQDPTVIGLTAEQAGGVCVDGLCISSTADIVEAHSNGSVKFY